MLESLYVTKLRIQLHIRQNRAKYAAATTAAAAYALSRRSVNQWNEFLDEHNLTDEFYAPEES